MILIDPWIFRSSKNVCLLYDWLKFLTTLYFIENYSYFNTLISMEEINQTRLKIIFLYSYFDVLMLRRLFLSRQTKISRN